MTVPTNLTDEQLIEWLLAQPESVYFDCKRMAGKPDKLLDTVSAFANTEGGAIALEDPDKASGHARLYGLQEHPENWDEFRRKLRSKISDPDDLNVQIREVPCKLRDGRHGTVGLAIVEKSLKVHSVFEGGTWTRLERSNRQMSAGEITNLAFARGTVTAESGLTDVDFQLLDTDHWRSYATKRSLTRPIELAMYHLGIAKRRPDSTLAPLCAAVLLFAEHPSGLVGGKASIRIFHYKGREISADPNTNLVRPPQTVGGPLIEQIRGAARVVEAALGERVIHSTLGFEIAQRYPVRVLNEAITNAVIHRDYRLPTDIHIRIFSDRVEVESPGRLPGRITTANIRTAGSLSRNPLLVSHLREFPFPPNLDAGEGVPMMFRTMHQAGLYPPQIRSRALLEREAVLVTLLNESRPTVWEQVVTFLEQNGSIGNAELRKLMETEDTLRASKQLTGWVEQGFLVVANPDAGRNVRRYVLPQDAAPTFFSNPDGKEAPLAT